MFTTANRENAPTAHPLPEAIQSDASLADLGRQLSDCEVFLTAFTAVPDNGDATDRLHQLLVDRHWALREEIDRLPARTIRELQIKVEAAWSAVWMEENSGVLFYEDTEGSVHSLLASIRKDVAAMAMPAS
jgi:hypothetical protein